MDLPGFPWWGALSGRSEFSSPNYSLWAHTPFSPGATPTPAERLCVNRDKVALSVDVAFHTAQGAGHSISLTGRAGTAGGNTQTSTWTRHSGRQPVARKASAPAPKEFGVAVRPPQKNRLKNRKFKIEWYNPPEYAQ